MTTGLYSQHLNDRKKLFIRNIVLALLLPTLLRVARRALQPRAN